jgi:glycosyltransferase involved in cell wall biosynthesis
MTIIYRISDNGYNKVKPDYINNEKCIGNAVRSFKDDNWLVIADDVSQDTSEMIEEYVSNHSRYKIKHVSVGNGAGTFNIALDEALKLDDGEAVYFLENDYLHHPSANMIMNEGLELGASFVSLYDHPDKYMTPEEGGNPFCEDGGEETRVYLSDSCHWKITNSTTMTFAATVGTLRQYEPILRKWTSGTHPNDFQMFLELRDIGALLITPIPGYHH